MIPVKIGMTIIITRFTTGPRPMNVWLWCFPFRIILALAFMVLVFITPLYQLEGCFIFSIFKYLIFKFIFCVRIVFHYLLTYFITFRYATQWVIVAIRQNLTIHFMMTLMVCYIFTIIIIEMSCSENFDN